MKYYKVVRKFDKDVYVSAIINQKEFRIQYKIGEWTKKIEGTGGIFVFNALDSALQFRRDNDIWGVIFECQVKNPRKLKIRYPTKWNLFEFWDEFYKLRSKHKGVNKIQEILPSVYACSSDTYIANEIKLVKRV